jgi:citrate lyase gamma subunit
MGSSDCMNKIYPSSKKVINICMSSFVKQLKIKKHSFARDSY